MGGIQIAVTYHSNICCSCCSYNCAPYKRGWMQPDQFQNNVEKAVAQGYTDFIQIEGGEPFLNSALLYRYLRSILKYHIPVYIRTNGFWGNLQPYTEILGKLMENGLRGITLEYDFFHSASIDFKTAIHALQTAGRTGLERRVLAHFETSDISTIQDEKTFQYLKAFRSHYVDMRYIFNVMKCDQKHMGTNIVFCHKGLGEKSVIS